MRSMLGAALTLSAVAAILLIVIWTQQRRLIYFPFGSTPGPKAVGLPGAIPVTFQTDDGLGLNGWFVSPDKTSWFTVIVFNGNAGNRAFRAPLAAALVKHGVSVLLFDYRGFGGNAGAPTESGLALDGRAALRHVLGRPDVDPKRLAYFGESLGAAVASELAAEFPPAALILRSPFASMADIGKFHYPLLPVRFLVRDRFSTIDRIRRIQSPLLIVAGDRDRIVPPEQSRRLYDAANEPKRLVIIPGADHNDDALLSGRQLIDAVVAFLRSVPQR